MLLAFAEFGPSVEQEFNTKQARDQTEHEQELDEEEAAKVKKKEVQHKKMYDAKKKMWDMRRKKVQEEDRPFSDSKPELETIDAAISKVSLLETWQSPKIALQAGLHIPMAYSLLWSL
jgi:hypothetical protein